MIIRSVFFEFSKATPETHGNYLSNGWTTAPRKKTEQLQQVECCIRPQNAPPKKAGWRDRKSTVRMLRRNLKSTVKPHIYVKIARKKHSNQLLIITSALNMLRLAAGSPINSIQ